MSIITLQNSLGVQRSIVMYINRSYSWSVTSITSITGLVGILIDQFLDAIKCINKRLANTVVILKAQLSVKGLKVVRNVSKVSYSKASKLKLIIRASINLSGGFSTSSPSYSKINWLIQLLSLFLDLLYSSQVCLIDQYPSLPHTKHFQLVRLRGYVFVWGLPQGLRGLSRYGCCQRQWRSVKQTSKSIYRY